MRVGIDFGTTHTVAAVVDRGNYPVASFDGVDTWPSLIAANASSAQRFLTLDAFTQAGLRRPVRRSDDGPDVEERYVVTPGGAVEVTLKTRPARLRRTFRLERHDLATA
jgi:hypothetical protein